MKHSKSPYLFDRIAIIGLGLIGSSIARAAREHNLAQEIVACDLDETALVYARSQNFIDSGTRDPKAAAKNSSLIILCTPPSTLSHLTEKIAPALIKGAIVMDVASTKVSAMEDIARHLPSHANFVPAHPIAGSEHSGIMAGRADLFKGKRVIITPTDPMGESIKNITAFWSAMGARVEGMPAEVHDLLYGYVSHLPQLLAFGLKGLFTGDHSKRLQKFLRLTHSDPKLWADIFVLNKDNIFTALERYLDVIYHVENELMQAPEGEGEQTGDDVLARTVLFPRIVASCLITTVMEAEKKSGFSFARFAGSGFADFVTPAAETPDEDIEKISNHHRAVAAILRAYAERLKYLRMLIETRKWDELTGAL